MADLKSFAEQLVNLTVKEVNELAQILKDEYGIEPAAAAPVMTAPPYEWPTTTTGPDSASMTRRVLAISPASECSEFCTALTR